MAMTELHQTEIPTQFLYSHSVTTGELLEIE